MNLASENGMVYNGKVINLTVIAMVYGYNISMSMNLEPDSKQLSPGSSRQCDSPNAHASSPSSVKLALLLPDGSFKTSAQVLAQK